VVLALEGTQRLHADFEERAVYIIEGEQTNERTKGLTVLREGPIRNQIEFGLSGTIAIRSDVMANIFDAVGEELAFFQLESDAVFDENVANAFKEVEKRSKDRGPEQDVVDNNAATKVRSTSRVTRSVERLPFPTEDTHHTSIESWSIARPKRHHRPAVFVVVGGEECQLLLVLLPNTDLVITGFVVQGNEEETTSGVAEVINSIVATWNRVLKR
jgi:hypothetical protein